MTALSNSNPVNSSMTSMPEYVKCPSQPAIRLLPLVLLNFLKNKGHFFVSMGFVAAEVLSAVYFHRCQASVLALDTRLPPPSTFSCTFLQN